jgi:hypothetical protein
VYDLQHEGDLFCAGLAGVKHDDAVVTGFHERGQLRLGSRDRGCRDRGTAPRATCPGNTDPDAERRLGAL